MTTGRAACLLLALLVSGLAAHAQEEEILPSDPRVVEANALLEKESGWPRAIELYRAALADDPEEDGARMWLARVLAWAGRYDESLEQYDVFLARPEPPDWAAPERADVLSWAGRSDEAEAAFQALLAADPRDLRAARGLARNYQWAGRSSDAIAAWKRVLELQEDDPEAHQQLAALRSARGGSSGEADVSYFVDSDEFQMTRSGVRGAAVLDDDTQLLVRGAYIRVEAERTKESPDPDRREHADAVDGAIGLRRHFGDKLEATAEVGGRGWSHADETFVAHGELAYTHSEWWTASLSLDYGDFLEGSTSLDAVLENIRATTLRGSTWRGFGPQWATYVYLESTFLSDHNRRVSGGASLDYRPVSAWDLSLSLALDLLHTAHPTDHYYDPNFNVNGSVVIRGGVEILPHLRLELETSGGYGWGEQDGVKDGGFTYGVAGGPKVGLGDWWIGVRGHRSQTIRGTSYSSNGVSLNLGRGF
jgi:tetratricopeptide (TPR) repeat protein